MKNRRVLGAAVRQTTPKQADRRWAALRAGLPVAVALAGTLVGAADVRAAQVHRDIPISRMYQRTVIVPAGQTYVWETTDLSLTADTVLHLWRTGSGEVGFDDNGGLGNASRVSYTNNTSNKVTLILIARARNSLTGGTARLRQNGATLESSFAVGGRRISVEGPFGYEHETVQAPGGDVAPFLLALDDTGHLLDLDFNSGVGEQARVRAVGTDSVVVGTPYGTGLVHLYSNDAIEHDDDGDGVGAGLEAELGTCDRTGWAGCGDVYNTQDTDRDGIPDAAEVFGIDDAVDPQHLPAWGADPLHKDVFVEIDWHVALGATNIFSESDILQVQARYEVGGAADLVNPDGLDGVRLHIDAGYAPADTANITLLGDWGGSSAVPNSTSYGTAPATYRSAARAGVFHYALLAPGNGGGQAATPGDRFVWAGNGGNRNPDSFAHELGHNLNLRHWGHAAWGAVNGKPNYVSIMNYAFGGLGFSTHQSSVVLNPAIVNEMGGIGADASLLAGNPYFRQIGINDEVDWDFDGDFSGNGLSQIRSALTYATWVGTSALTVNEQSLHQEADLPATTPAIMSRGDNLYVFYVDDGRIYYRHSKLGGGLTKGQCPGGDEIGDTCTSWSNANEVPSFADARGVTAIYADGQVLLAFRTASDGVRTIRAKGVKSSGELTSWQGEFAHSGASTNKEPELELMRVDPGMFGGQELVVGLFYRDTKTGEYAWRTMENTYSNTSTSQGRMTDGLGQVLKGTQSPTFTAWPYDPTSTEDGTICGAVTNTAAEVGLYCYDRTSNSFRDRSSSAFTQGKPVTTGKPGLGFHAYRSVFGVPVNNEASRGAFWLSVTVGDPNWDFVDVWISDPISTQPGEELSAVYFPRERRGKAGNEWTNLVDGTGMAIYDAGLGSMKAVWLRQDGGDQDSTQAAPVVRFLPFADGTFRAQLKDGNDFQVMERGICLGLANGSSCGDSSFGLN